MGSATSCGVPNRCRATSESIAAEPLCSSQLRCHLYSPMNDSRSLVDPFSGSGHSQFCTYAGRWAGQAS
jgi:hypothetical protein